MKRYILSGRLKNRLIPIQPSTPCRPTLSIHRERIFNWLQKDLVGSKCLDLFGGSGALGLESLSRGADKVVILENFIPQCNLLVSNFFDEINKKKLVVICNDTLDILKKKNLEQFDIVFLDPPFTKDLWIEVQNLLLSNNWVRDGTLLVREIPSTYYNKYLCKPWRLLKEKISKTISIQLYVVCF